MEFYGYFFFFVIYKEKLLAKLRLYCRKVIKLDSVLFIVCSVVWYSIFTDDLACNSIRLCEFIKMIF